MRWELRWSVTTRQIGLCVSRPICSLGLHTSADHLRLNSDQPLCLNIFWGLVWVGKCSGNTPLALANHAVGAALVSQNEANRSLRLETDLFPRPPHQCLPSEAEF